MTTTGGKHARPSIPEQQAREMLAVELPWPSNKLSPNWRGHWSRRYHASSAARQTAGWRAREVVAPGTFDPDEPVYVVTTFYPPDRRSYDQDNLLARMKAAYDGISDAIGVDDKHFRHHPVQIGEPVKGGKAVVKLARADTWEHISEPLARVISAIPMPRRGAA